MDQLVSYVLRSADNNLILTQRNGEWCGHVTTTTTSTFTTSTTNHYVYPKKKIQPRR